MRIVLASASPRRRELLEQAGIDFEILIGSTRECITKEEPGEIVEELSLAKAKGVAEAVTGDAVIIGADTIVAKGNKVLGKPKDAEDAHQMLAMLQGEKHQVYTGVTLLQKKGDERIIRSFHERTDVFMTSMSDQEIEAYIATGEPFDKAGSYGIQGRAGIFVERIEGDYYNVVGLPISRLCRELKSLEAEGNLALQIRLDQQQAIEKRTLCSESARQASLRGMSDWEILESCGVEMNLKITG